MKIVRPQLGVAKKKARIIYRELVNRADGEAWFAVMPTKSASNVVSFSTRQASA